MQQRGRRAIAPPLPTVAETCVHVGWPRVAASMSRRDASMADDVQHDVYDRVTWSDGEEEGASAVTGMCGHAARANTSNATGP